MFKCINVFFDGSGRKRVIQEMNKIPEQCKNGVGMMTLRIPVFFTHKIKVGEFLYWKEIKNAGKVSSVTARNPGG
jgi:hypothetical protein